MLQCAHCCGHIAFQDFSRSAQKTAAHNVECHFVIVLFSLLTVNFRNLHSLCLFSLCFSLILSFVLFFVLLLYQASELECAANVFVVVVVAVFELIVVVAVAARI